MDSFDGIVEFIAVAESRGFSAASRQLDVSTSHVSRQVARLEERLGIALLARTTRQVSLTQQGEVYYRHCRGLMDGLQQANDEVSSDQVQLSGTLRVSAAGSFAERYVAPALIEFAEQHPQLVIDLDFDSRMVNFVEEGIDFAIRYGRLQDSGLIARKLVERHLVAAASPGYLDRHGRPQHPDDLRSHSCLISNNDSWTFMDATRPLTVRIQGRWRSNNANAVVAACRSGLGIAYMPRSSFQEGLRDGTLEAVLEPFWNRRLTSWIVYQNRRFLPQRARLAIEYLLTRFRDWDE